MKLKYLFVMFVILMFLAGCGDKKVVVPETPVAEESKQEAPAPEPVPEPVVEEKTEPSTEVEMVTGEEKSEKPEEEAKCGTDTFLTYTGCSDMGEGKYEVTFMNSGRGDVEGLWVYIASDGGSMGYEEITEKILVTEKKAYTLDLAKWEEKLGNVEYLELYPVKIMEDTHFSCMNNRQRVVPKVNCKKDSSVPITRN